MQKHIVFTKQQYRHETAYVFSLFFSVNPSLLEILVDLVLRFHNYKLHIHIHHKGHPDMLKQLATLLYLFKWMQYAATITLKIGCACMSVGA